MLREARIEERLWDAETALAAAQARIEELEAAIDKLAIDLAWHTHNIHEGIAIAAIIPSKEDA